MLILSFSCFAEGLTKLTQEKIRNIYIRTKIAVVSENQLFYTICQGKLSPCLELLWEPFKLITRFTFSVVNRAATIQAETEGKLWAMDRQTFRRILLKSAFRKRKMYEALLDAVPMLKTLQVCTGLRFLFLVRATNPLMLLFSTFSSRLFFHFHLQNYERMNLADALIPKTFAKGERIIKQGKYTCTDWGASGITSGNIVVMVEHFQTSSQLSIRVSSLKVYFSCCSVAENEIDLWHLPVYGSYVYKYYLLLQLVLRTGMIDAL